MTENLLEAPERGAIEALLKKCSAGFGQAPTFERLLGFVSGAMITPGGFDAADWLQPLFDLNGIVFTDIADIELFMAALTPLYDRVEAVRLSGENVCPFDLRTPEVLNQSVAVIDWATGLHCAVQSQEDIWIPYEDEVDFVDDKLKDEVNLNIQSLTTLVEPSSIPDIIKDPVPFQRNVLSHCPGWSEESLRETWDDELVEMVKLYCIGRLDRITASLQRYAKAYDEGDVVVVDCQNLGREVD